MIRIWLQKNEAYHFTNAIQVGFILDTEKKKGKNQQQMIKLLGESAEPKSKRRVIRESHV